MAQQRRRFKHLLAAEEQQFADAVEKQTSFAPNPTRTSEDLLAKGTNLIAIIILALATGGWLWLLARLVMKALELITAAS